MSEAAQILVRTGVDLKTFREEIQPGGRPVVLEGLVSDWPAVRAARESPRALADVIRGFDRGHMPNIIEVPAAAQGRIFYREDMSGMNFTRHTAPIGVTLDRLLSLSAEPDPVSLFIESTVLQDFLPDFAAAHPMPLLDAAIAPHKRNTKSRGAVSRQARTQHNDLRVVDVDPPPPDIAVPERRKCTGSVNAGGLPDVDSRDPAGTPSSRLKGDVHQRNSD